MPIDSGKLRHRVRIEEFVLDVDTSGDVDQDPQTGETPGQWVEVATVWAAIEPLSVKELIAAQATQSRIAARIVIRNRSDLNAAMRLVHLVNGARGTVYNIHGLLHDPESGMEYVTIPASAGISDSGQ